MKRYAPYGGKLHRLTKPRGRHAPRKSGRGGPPGGLVLHHNHPAVLEGRTLFPKSVTDAHDSPRVLVSGVNQRKIGKGVDVGRWKGMPIYCLTLEERATCPRSCLQWRACYGNNMHLSRRHVLNDNLFFALYGEVAALAAKYPRGFVVRLHVLGDFGSPDDVVLATDYVNLWIELLASYPALRIFGYTAHRQSEAIGSVILEMCERFQERCWIRFSGSGTGRYGADVIEHGADSTAIWCPAQRKKANGRDMTDCCGTCGLCWTAEKTIEFERH